MFDVSNDNHSAQQRAILRKLRVWIAALAIACLVAGIGIGAMLSGRPTVAQTDLQIARAPEALSASFAEIARRVEPAVVNIETLQPTVEVSDRDPEDKEDTTKNHPLLDMFRRQQRRPTRGVGSGFIVSPKGYILTNEHVIEDASRIIVGLQSGQKYRGEVVGVDPETDVAVIKIDAQDLPTVTLGDSNDAQVGDWVLAMGSPFGLDQTVTAGIISKKERESPYFTNFQRFLQTDAAINRGNSGGPLVNMRGEVIGMNSQIATSTGDYNGIGFALPANETNFVYKQIIAHGKVKRGYLGVTLESVHDEFAKVYGMATAKGAIVTSVTPTENGQVTPAAKAGIQSNDVIVEFEGNQIVNAQDLIQRVASTPVGQSATLVYLRDVDGKLEKRSITVVLSERPRLSANRTEVDVPKSTPKQSDPKGNTLHLGITLAELTPQMAADKRLTGVRGLYIEDIDPNGLVAEVRLPPSGAPALSEGDVITRINRVAVNSLADFQRVLSGLKQGDPIVLHVTTSLRDGRGERLAPRIVQFTYQ